MTRSSTGIIEIVLNLFGTAGYFIGHTLLLACFGKLWVNLQTAGLVWLSAAFVSAGIAQLLYGIRFCAKKDSIGVYSTLQNGFGCLVFAFASIFPLISSSFSATQATYAAYLIGSMLFLTGYVLSQLNQRLWLGVLAPFVSNRARVIPTGLLNTVGALFFFIANNLLFYGKNYSRLWFLEIGSIMFLIAAWGDATLWWGLSLVHDSPDTATKRI